MSNYELGRSDEGPGKAIQAGRRWFPFWRKIVEAFAEGYGGWVTMRLPVLKDAKSALQSLYHHRRRTIQASESLEFCYRKQEDGTFIVYARMTRAEEDGDA